MSALRPYVMSHLRVRICGLVEDQKRGMRWGTERNHVFFSSPTIDCVLFCFSTEKKYEWKSRKGFLTCKQIFLFYVNFTGKLGNKR